MFICTDAAAAAKSLQSCPTLCDPIDGSHQALIDSKEYYHNLFMLYVFKFFERTEAIIRKLQYYCNILVDGRDNKLLISSHSFLFCHYVALRAKIE